MGLYTETIRKRDSRDRELVRSANARIESRIRDGFVDEGSDDTWLAVNYILGKFGISAKEVHGFKNTQEMLDLMLDPLGVIYDIVDTADPEWKKRSEYMLGFLENGTEDGLAVCLLPALKGYSYYCPATGEKGSVDGLELRDTAYAVQRPIKGRITSLLTFARYVLHLVSPRDIVLIGTATLMVSALGMVTPKMNQYVLQEIVPMGNDGCSVLLRSLELFLLTGVIKTGISAAKTICLGGMKVRISSEVQSAVMARVLLLPQNFFTGSSTGKLSRKISNVRLLTEQIISFVMGASLTAVFSLVYIPQMESFSKLLLAPAVVILLLKSIYTLIAGYFYAENERERQDAEMEQRAFTYTALKGVQRIKESGAEKRIYAKWTDRYQATLACDMDQPGILKLEDAAISFLTSLGTVILLSLIVPGDIPKSDYIAFTAAFALITNAITDLMEAQRKLFLMKPMMTQLKELLNIAPEDAENQTLTRHLRGDIRMENVSFAYEGNSFGCLEDVSLHIEPGEKIAIVGESGCGKSTLLKILLGVLKPVSGGVFIDNVPLETMHFRSFRRHIGAVFQSSKVMPGTVYSNIAFSPRPVSREEAEEAAEKACIADMINALPLGYDTEISDSNSGGFSGGQRQRLLLARAFASKPDLMILDEATSALDNISQSRVLESVYAEKCTVIMVAHRLSTVRDCDRIILLKSGRIAEEGSFDELMEKKGEFYELMRRQEG